MEDYKKLLEKVRKDLPEHVFQKERFEIPNVRGHIQGNRTVISNFLQIAGVLGREPESMLKFVLRELATPGEIKKSGSVIMGTKVPASRINEKVKQYANSYVFCYECGKPDTKIEKEDNFSFLKCTACGARHSIKSKVKL
tara:strand:+ start:188 stop:607 length:420 start_codon:yes stop_codon:yes gene_type:complete